MLKHGRNYTFPSHCIVESASKHNNDIKGSLVFLYLQYSIIGVEPGICKS
jgi:hypothetical protein